MNKAKNSYFSKITPDLEHFLRQEDQYHNYEKAVETIINRKESETNKQKFVQCIASLLEIGMRSNLGQQNHSQPDFWQTEQYNQTGPYKPHKPIDHLLIGGLAVLTYHCAFLPAINEQGIKDSADAIERFRFTDDIDILMDWEDGKGQDGYLHRMHDILKDIGFRKEYGNVPALSNGRVGQVHVQELPPHVQVHISKTVGLGGKDADYGKILKYKPKGQNERQTPFAEYPLFGIPIRVPEISLLIAMKKSAGRKKDRDDVKVLKKIKDFIDKKGA